MSKLDDKLIAYRNGGEGMVLWAEENVRVPVYPEGSDIPKWTYLGKLPKEKHSITNRSYYDMWQEQKKELYEALKMDKEKRFVHRLIILIEQRGEGKSLKAVLIQMWKFFCFPRQRIMLAANSKDQYLHPKQGYPVSQPPYTQIPMLFFLILYLL